MEKTIRVTGKGKISVAPDTVRMLITQSGTLSSYEDSIRDSAEKKGNLNKELGKLGFEKEELKTLKFNVDTEYESYQAKDKSWKKRLIGYRYVHRMKLEFPKESDLLGRVLGVLAINKGKPEFSLQYTISDPEAAKNELLAKAVADSKAKAVVLTEAAGVEIREIQSIDYSWGELEFITRPVEDSCMDYCCSDEIAYPTGIPLDVEPDDIDVTDTVTVVWAIK